MNNTRNTTPIHNQFKIPRSKNYVAGPTFNPKELLSARAAAKMRRTWYRNAAAFTLAYRGVLHRPSLAGHLGVATRHGEAALQASCAALAAWCKAHIAGRTQLARFGLIAAMSLTAFTAGLPQELAASAGIVTPSRTAVEVTTTTRAQVLDLAAADMHVMGVSTLTAAELALWYHARARHEAQLPSLGGDVAALAQIFLDEGAKLGVRGDVAFVQSMLETSYLSFPSWGQIRPWFNNYSGMYAFDGRSNGWECRYEARPSRCFTTPADGVQVQLHLLRGYADSVFARQPMVRSRPPWDRIGSAPTWDLFGTKTGKIVWGSTPDYGQRVLRAWRDAVTFTSANLALGT